MTTATVLFYSMIFNPATITLGNAVKSLDSKYTQQKIKNVTSYLGYYPSGAADISLYIDTGHSFESATSITLPYKKVHGYFGSLNSYTINVKVPDVPVLSSVTDEDGDNKDSNNSYSVVRFTLSGNNFRKNINSAKGKVTFVRVDDNSTGTADISSWSDTEIKGSVVLPGGKYWVHVTVKGYITENEVFYYKGIGDVGF